ncbi:MAG: hypothetical protein ABFC91_03765 [Methanobacteriaceae archaeon]
MNLIKNLSWKVRLGLFLVIISLILYTVLYFVFHELHHQLFLLGIDLAFVPLEVLFVVLVIETALGEREKRVMLEKMNMVIGTFFSEVGSELLSRITSFDPDTDKIRNSLRVNVNWSSNDYQKAIEEIENFDYTLKISGDDVVAMEFLESNKEFLMHKRNFLLGLLENPNLLEHETFTDLLRAVFHLTEELESRSDLTNLPRADYIHLAGDTKRVYSILIYQWLRYMEYLSKNYPYLFSLAVRKNPFDPEASVEIQG